MRSAAAGLSALAILTSACGAYGTGLPNGDTVQRTYDVYLIAGGSSKHKRILIEFYNVPNKRDRRFEIGQFASWHYRLNSGAGIKLTVINLQETDFVSCRVRTEPETAEVYTSATHTARCYKKMP